MGQFDNSLKYQQMAHKHAAGAGLRSASLKRLLAVTLFYKRPA